MITAIRESKKQNRQSQIKQQPLLTTKTQCLSIFVKKNNEKLEKNQVKSKLNQMNGILPEKIWELFLLRILNK